uniref:Uncharacterized protein n=1 Tax=Helianthus annuus TaxID=4232 RepID=A0A251SWE3_HELAN
MAIDAVVSESAHVSVENVKKESSANGHVGENESGPHVMQHLVNLLHNNNNLLLVLKSARLNKANTLGLFRSAPRRT